MDRMFETNCSFHVKHYEKSEISNFQELFGSIDKIFIFGRKIGH